MLEKIVLEQFVAGILTKNLGAVPKAWCQLLPWMSTFWLFIPEDDLDAGNQVSSPTLCQCQRHIPNPPSVPQELQLEC